MVREDKIIRFSDSNEYRMVTIYDEFKEVYLALISNIEKLAAATIGDIYRDRWQIEVFFRYLKQNLKIKTFVGTSPNAVLIQVELPPPDDDNWHPRLPGFAFGQQVFR